MIRKLRIRIFLIVELLPMFVMLLVLISYNYSFISYTLSDEIETLDYCADCVENYPDSMDKYLRMPIEDLVKVSDSKSVDNNKIRNVLYTIIAQEVNVIKLDSDNKPIDSARGIGNMDLSLYDREKGKAEHNLYKYAQTEDYRYLIVLDTDNWRSAIILSVALSLAAMILAGLIFMVVALYLSKKVTAPVEEAITKQNRFVADASHELKTPIAVINANIAVLEQEYGENKWMNYIKEEGQSMNQCINQMLSLSRLDYENSERKKHDHEETFNVYDAIMESVLPFDSVAFEKKAIITTYCDRAIMGKGSRTDFKRIVSILADNAVDHVNCCGEIIIKVRKVKNKVEILVSNTGSHIEKKNLPYVFDRFYKARKDELSASRAEHAPSENRCVDDYSYGKRNFGLGLSIAKALSDRNSFEIKAASESDTTTFTVTIPYVKDRY